MSAPQPTPQGGTGKRFNVVITGAIRAGFDKDQVCRSLAQLAHLNAQQAAELLGGQARVVKSNVDQSTATQFQMKFEAIGVQCAVRPVTPTVAAPGKIIPAASADPKTRALSTQTIAGVFVGDVEPVAITAKYKFGIATVAVFLVLLPALYLALVGALGSATVWHMLTHWTWLGKHPGVPMMLAYVGIGAAGLVSTIFLLKPFLAPRRQPGLPLKLTKQDDPLFFAFVEHIAKRVGAPMPAEIRIDCAANASAGALGGLSGLLSNQLVLTVGLPLVGGLSSRQLAGVIAHELGHFAQSTGMRFGYVVDSLNHWFARCVYERDPWDEKLTALSEQYNDYRGTVLLMCRGAIWLSRKCLAGARILGVLVSRFMSRQMEFDADQYEVRIAGSKAFETTAIRLHEFNAATEVVYKRLSYSWADAKLSDNYPMMIVDESAKLPERYREAIQDAISEEKPSLWTTHPTDRERINRAKEQDTVGVYQSELPATALLPRFDRLCKQASLYHYRQVFGLSVTAEQLVSTAVVTAQADQGEADDEQLKIYMSTLFAPIRFIPIKRQSAFAVPDLKETKNRIEAIVQKLRAAMPDYEASLDKYLDAYNRRIAGYAARSLASQGITFDHHALRVSAATIDAADAAISAASSDMAALDGTMKQFETQMGQRMELAFSTRMDSETQNSLNILVQALTALVKTHEAVVQLRCFISAANLVANSPESSNGTSWRIYAGYCGAEYEKVLGLLASAPYPFDRGDSVQTVADYVRQHCGPPEQLKDDATALDARGKNIWKCVEYLHYRIIARLSAIAARAEEALGVTPLRTIKTKPADTPSEDVPDDKLPF